MKIELKNIKHAAFASDETACFSATVYIDGQKAGTVENEGHGGPCLFHPYEVGIRIDAYGKTLPPIHAYGTDLTQTADLIVSTLLEDYLTERDVKRLLAKRIVYTRSDKPGLYQTKTIPAADLTRLLGGPLPATWKVAQVLNALPISEAVKVYRAQTR